MTTDWPRLWREVSAQFACDPESVHGPTHWQRVERTGLVLARHTGANVEVVRLFALFHDARRRHDDSDNTHGQHGAAFATSLRGVLFELADPEFELLHYACTWHTHGQLSDDPTIGTCWDADRLDLGRVGIQPRAEYLSTATGREIARRGGMKLFLGGAEET